MLVEEVVLWNSRCWVNSFETVLRLEGGGGGLTGSVPPPSFHSLLGLSQDRQDSCMGSTAACNWLLTGGTRQDDSYSLSVSFLKEWSFIQLLQIRRNISKVLLCPGTARRIK